jgi:hypothetical protein
MLFNTKLSNASMHAHIYSVYLHGAVMKMTDTYHRKAGTEL